MTRGSSEEIIVEMRRRIRVYMASVSVLIVFGFGGAIWAAKFLHTIGGTRMLSGLAFTLGIFTTVGLAWVLVYKLIRCPQCDRLVVWTFSMNTSLFATGSSQCPGCGAQLFAEGYARRFGRTILGLALLSALAGFLFAYQQRQRQPEKLPSENPIKSP